MSGQILYQAKVPCRIGGAYRREGEVFPMPEFKKTPPYLVKLGPEEDVASKKNTSAKQPENDAPGPMPADLPGVVRD